jgi:3-dehydroquinate synthase
MDAQLGVHWTHRLRFTTRVFDPGNVTLRDVLPDAAEDPARVLAVIDSGLAQRWPKLEEQIRRYADAHRSRLSLAGQPLIVPGGEDAKNDRSVFDSIIAAIDGAGLCRRSYVLAIGGGAVLDVAGFAAASAHRGVRIIRLPTTTLAQDDAGVGVKNGINALGKKNFLGAFAVPWAVINDVEFLTTLTDRDWRSGLSEAVKVAVVKDRKFFDAIARAAPRLIARDLPTMGEIVHRSAELHLQHIALGGDPFELREARPLDFGHWSAHKLEQMTGFRLRHGEAVAIGIALDVTYSALQGWLSEPERDQILAVLRGLGFEPLDVSLCKADDLLAGLEEFREHLGGRLTITMLRGIGQAFEVYSVDHAIVIEAVSRLAGEAGQNAPTVNGSAAVTPTHIRVSSRLSERDPDNQLQQG